MSAPRRAAKVRYDARRYAKRRALRAELLGMAPCPECGRPVPDTATGRGRIRKFCSDRCSSIASSRRYYERLRQRRCA